MKDYILFPAVAIGLLLTMFSCHYYEDNCGVEVGDVWVSASCKDPFVRTFSHREVLDIQEGHVQYRYNNGITSSCSIRILKFDATRVKRGAEKP